MTAVHSISGPMPAGTPPSFRFVHEPVHMLPGAKNFALGSAAWTARVSFTALGEAIPASTSSPAGRPCFASERRAAVLGSIAVMLTMFTA